MRVPGLLLLVLAAALAAEPVAARIPPSIDQLAACDSPDGAGGLWRLRVVRQSGVKYLLRLQEHIDAQGGTTTQTMVADHLLVALRPGTDAKALATAQGCSLRRRIPGSDTWLFAFAVPDGAAPERMLARLAALPQVLHVACDWQVQIAATPDDPDFPQQWSLANSGQDGGTPQADIKATAAWDLATGRRSVVVGVLDTGIARDHTELAANMWTNPGESGLDAQGRDRRANGIDDDGNGFIDDWRGWDFVNDDNDPDDDHGHGTHCAGIIGATGNDGLGITGVCWQVSLVGIKFLDANGSGFVSDAIAAVDYARTLQLPIISNSWGMSLPSPELAAAFSQAADGGMLVLAAAGNGFGSDNDRHPVYPACYAMANLISVAASDSYDELSYFSNIGLHSVHIAAPGSDILSTIPTGHAVWSGTSMATPHVAGVAALIKSARPSLSAADIRQLILDGAERLPALFGACASGGRLDAASSLRLATGAWLKDAGATIGNGSGDGVPAPGESIAVQWTLANAGLADSGPVQVSLASASGDGAVSIASGAASVPALAPGTQTAVPALSFTTDAGLATPHTVQLLLTATWGGGGRITRNMEVVLRRPCTLTGTVRRLGGGLPIPGAAIAAVAVADQASFPFPHASGADGSYSLTLPEGSYSIQAQAAGLIGVASTITVPPAQTLDLQMGAPAIHVAAPAPITLAQGAQATVEIAVGDLGDMPLHWQASVAGQYAATGLWHATGRRTWAGDPVWWYGREETGNFATGSANRGDLTLPAWDVPANGETLAFWSWRDAESSAADAVDKSQVELSDDGGATWRSVLDLRDSDAGSEAWHPEHVDLAAWAGRRILARFHFDTVDAINNEGEGWYIAGITACGQAFASQLCCSPASGTSFAGGTTTCAVTIDSTGLPAGAGSIAVTFQSDDAGQPAAVVALPLVVTPAPAPRLLAMTMDDAPPGGDGDGWAEYGETISWTPRFANAGAAATLSCHLTMDGGDALVLSGDAAGTIAAGATGDLPPFRLRIQAWTAGDRDLTGTLAVTSAGSTRLLPVALTISARNAVGGVVVDGVTGAPRSGQEVRLLSASGLPAAPSQYTAADGRFRFPDLAAYQNYTVAIDVAGMSPLRRSVSLPPDQDLTLAIGQRLLSADTASLTCSTSPGGTAAASFTLSSSGSLAVAPLIRSAAAAHAYLVETSDDPAGPAYAWNDISASGTPLTAASLDYHTVGPVELGFAFPFFAHAASSCSISPTGWLSFTEHLDFTYPFPFPSVGNPRDSIATWWDFLAFDDLSAIYTRQLDAQSFLVQADGLISSSQQGRISYQTLLAADGTITMAYRTTRPGAYTVIGLQDLAADQGLALPPSSPASDAVDPRWTARDATAVRFTPSRRFTTLADGLATGRVRLAETLAPGANATITVTCSAQGLAAGTYRDRILISSDAQDHPWISIPITLQVGGDGSGGPAGDAAPVAAEGGGGSHCGLGSGLALVLLLLGLGLFARATATPRRQRPC